tara:strand:- start:2028 stop:2714 length:687 start_codon:yes stop_codon:yes gene_type:complete
MNLRNYLILLIFFVHGCEKPPDEGYSTKEEQSFERIDLEASASEGNAEAQFRLAEHLLKGPLQDRNETKGVLWLRFAAEQGLASAQYELGESFLNGIGVRKNENEAIRWLNRAAEQGQPMAQNVLGWIFANKTDGTHDYKKAVQLFQASADQGYAVAQANLSTMYRDGKGVHQNPMLAYVWWKIALEYSKSLETFNQKDSPSFSPTPGQMKDIQKQMTEIRSRIEENR